MGRGEDGGDKYTFCISANTDRDSSYVRYSLPVKNWKIRTWLSLPIVAKNLPSGLNANETGTVFFYGEGECE